MTRTYRSDFNAILARRQTASRSRNALPYDIYRLKKDGTPCAKPITIMFHAETAADAIAHLQNMNPGTAYTAVYR